MSTIYTVEGNTSAGSTLVANGGGVAKKSYAHTYARIAKIWCPNFKKGEAEKVAKVAMKYRGYLEKKSAEFLEDFTKNAGYNNFNRFAPYAYKMTKNGVYVNGVAWCDIFVDAIFIEALGVERAKELLNGWSAYTPTSSNYLKNGGAKEIKDFSKATVGCVIFFKNNSGGICHTGIVVTGVPEDDGSLSAPASTTYTQKDFIKDVCAILGAKTAKEALPKTITLSKNKNSKHALVLPVQKYLKSLGYYTGAIDRDYGTLSAQAVTKYQEKVVKATKANCDGIITAKNATWKKMLGV